MKTFTIEDETSNIIAHATAHEADAVPNADQLTDEAGFAALASAWPTARLVEIWNSLPGVTPVNKFKDRNTATLRIWKAIRTLGDPAETDYADEPAAEETVDEPSQIQAVESEENTPATEATDGIAAEKTGTDVRPQEAPVPPDEAPSANGATRTKKSPKAPRVSGDQPREGSKTSQVIAMLKREGGATLEEIMTATGWQKHTTRAMLSAGGSLTKNHGLCVSSEKVGDHRRYSIKG